MNLYNDDKTTNGYEENNNWRTLTPAEQDEFALEVEEYLNDLRESGITNMFGATTRILEAEFNLTHKDAKEFLVNWMKNFKS